MRRTASRLLLAAIGLALVSSAFAAARSEEDAERGYREFRAGLMELYSAEKYAEAAKLIEDNYDSFPGEEWKMSYNMAAVCQHLEEYDKGIKYLGMAQDKGQFFNTWAFQGDFWAKFRETDRFDRIITRNDEMKEEARKTSKRSSRTGSRA